jgi:hypothetical protein
MDSDGVVEFLGDLVEEIKSVRLCLRHVLSQVKLCS